MKQSLKPGTLGFPAPVFMVGSYDEHNLPNVMNAAAAGMCCLRPPCVYVALREATATYHNILKRKAFTICIPAEKYVIEADYFGVVSGKDTNKFQKTGLTPLKGDVVDAPYIQEFPVAMECKLKEKVDLGSHTMFIGEVLDLKADEDVLMEIPLNSGKSITRIDPQKVLPLIFDLSSRKYYALGDKIGEGFADGLKLKNKD